ncbi:MAG: DMT family transporter [Gemmatimonadetes bacterium]|jgi:drug/metabolite transporter (DMT)-like permease|nr:DMT family transporter [Gemmatimonadota bacterium]MBT5142248.1 DMT family transporter [Gemmatimonadota bacterium]MBT5589167.1 DMT family transporter [Gemmatimonadota bacterium]MBT5963183.1 DMT family transporter [Gemmatimonadota bacterium]MBT6626924.1 DMT family transporter [Gemmatimonadota bacterium]
MTQRTVGLAFGLGAVVLWGLSFVATRVALLELTPMAIVLGRTAFGALSLIIIATIRRQVWVVPRAAWPSLLVAGGLGVFLHQMLQAYGLTMTTAVRTGWLIGIIPVWSALLAFFVLGEHLRRVRVLGLLVGLAGVVVLLSDGQPGVALQLPQTRGDLLILASTVNWAVYTVLGRRILSRLDPLPATMAAMVVGLVLLLPPALFAGAASELMQVSLNAVLALLFLGVGCSALAYLLWFAALGRATTSSVASLLYFEPLVTLAGGVLLLGESVGMYTTFGGVMILGGVFLVQRQGDGEKEQPDV